MSLQSDCPEEARWQDEDTYWQEKSGRQTPISGRQTPNSQRRPLRQQIAYSNAPVLSPTKRRKQSHTEELSAVAVEPVKATVSREEGAGGVFSVAGGSSRGELYGVLLEVFSRLGHRDLVGAVAPASRLWCETAHSKELWAILRNRLRLVDQFPYTEKVVERRSKGKLFKCHQLGTGEAALMRVVDLELTNAGKDDGVPTSFLREAALLKKLQHPNVIRHFGSEILGKRAVTCTEYVFESFTTWYKRLETRPAADRLADIRVKFHQMLTGLSYVHHQGVMHRNLKPDNIFIDAQGIVKLGDFTTTRMLDIPFQAYTPEDPKERDRSGREMRRLWYRAPELVLRDDIYGPKVDMWSVGCLLAEAATGKALFQSDAEIDHLFRIFRLVGTPSIKSWPEVIAMKNFSPKFPVYPGFNLAQITRAVCFESQADKEALSRQARPDRDDILQNMFGAAAVLGPEGMLALDRLITMPPAERAGADDTLKSPFFRPAHDISRGTMDWVAGGKPPDLEHGRGDSFPEASALHIEGERQQMDDTPSAVLSGLGCCEVPPVAISSSLIPSDMVWSILNVMRRHEHPSAGFGGASAPGALLIPGRGAGLSEGNCRSCAAGALPRLPPDFDGNKRAVLVDFIIGLASTLSLTDFTLHLAVSIVDKYLALQEEAMPEERVQNVGATCLKVADVFAEQSKEYYKQENAVEYAEATMQQTSPDQMLAVEKDVLPKLGFDLHLPTTHWFLQCYLAYGRFTPCGNLAKTACFIGDLTLLDYDLLAYPHSLLAQCCLVLAVVLAQKARSEKREKARTGPEGGSNTAPAPALSSEGLAGTTLTYLEHWDKHVRNQVCQGNTAVDAAMCLQAVVKSLVVLRREWKSMKLIAVETKHTSLTRTMIYPEGFPVSKLVRYILPDCQRGLIAE